MHLHARATLTVQQRFEARRLHHEERVSIRTLAKRFHVSPNTIFVWVNRESPLDKSTAPLHTRSTVTPAYRSAVVTYRKQNPQRGAISVAYALRTDYPQANRGTVYRILKEEGLIGKFIKKPKKERKPIPVGRHRIQMDIQQLPAIKGQHGNEYKISMIHLNTRVKYSEIRPDRKTTTVVEVFQRALDSMPPFFS